MHGLLNYGRGIDGRPCRLMNISAFNAISPSRAFGQYMRRTLPTVAVLPCVRYMDHSLSTSKARDGARMLSYPQTYPHWGLDYNETLSKCYQIVINKSAMSTLKPIDSRVYAGHVQGREI